MKDSDIQPIEKEPSEGQVINLHQSDEYSKYLLYSKTEILAVLRSLIQKAAMVTAHFDQGNSYMLTSLIALSANNTELIFDVSRDAEMNRRALQANKLVFTTYIDKVKVQFSLEKLSSIQYEGYPAFSGAVPDKLLRLQRREFFRLSIPISAPVNLNADVRRGDGNTIELDIPLWDISGGGIGLLATTEQAQYLQRGDVLNECRILLPDETALSVNLVIRNMLEVTSRNGTRLVRIGCEFVNMPPSRLNIVQRYITRIERERKARTNGAI